MQNKIKYGWEKKGIYDYYDIELMNQKWFKELQQTVWEMKIRECLDILKNKQTIQLKLF